MYNRLHKPVKICGRVEYSGYNRSYPWDLTRLKAVHGFSVKIWYFILQADKFVKCDLLRTVVFKPNLKYLHVKITPVTSSAKCLPCSINRKQHGFFGVFGINTGSWYFKTHQISLVIFWWISKYHPRYLSQLPIETVLFPKQTGPNCSKHGYRWPLVKKYGQLRFYGSGRWLALTMLRASWDRFMWIKFPP